MSRAGIGMTLLLLSAVAECVANHDGSHPTQSSTSSHEGGRVAGERSARPSRGPAESTASPAGQRLAVSASPPYISRVRWVSLPSGRSFEVYPTPSGRTAIGEPAEGEAWREVVRKAPAAGSRSMRAQFDCHWAFARLAAPNKPSWNLEPWRPVVSAQQMYDARCNPGGPKS